MGTEYLEEQIRYKWETQKWAKKNGIEDVEAYL